MQLSAHTPIKATMNFRLRALAACPAILTLLCLAACAAVKSYSDEPPAGPGITGIWVLNPALSTDTRKALADLAPRPQRGHGPGSGPGGPGAGTGTGGTDPDDPANEPVDNPAQDPSQGQGQGQGRGRRGRSQNYDSASSQGQGRSNWRPPLDLQTDVLKGGEWLQISRRDDELVVANAAGSDSYTPGQQSVVSVATGVADQSTGWVGRDYVVELRPQIGPHILERYTPSPDGRQLTVHIKVDSEGPNKELKVVRVYDHADAVPATLPH